MDDAGSIWHGIKVKARADLPKNVVLARDMRGIYMGCGLDTCVWMIGEEDWDAMTPEQRQEFAA